MDQVQLSLIQPSVENHDLDDSESSQTPHRMLVWSETTVVVARWILSLCDHVRPCDLVNPAAL